MPMSKRQRSNTAPACGQHQPPHAPVSMPEIGVHRRDLLDERLNFWRPHPSIIFGLVRIIVAARNSSES